MEIVVSVALAVAEAIAYFASTYGFATLSVVIAGTGVRIALRQSATAREKLTLDLFEKRFDLYADLFLRHSWKSAEIAIVRTDMLARAQFLFGKKARELMLELFRAHDGFQNGGDIVAGLDDTYFLKLEQRATVQSELALLMAHQLEVPLREGKPRADLMS